MDLEVILLYFAEKLYKKEERLSIAEETKHFNQRDSSELSCSEQTESPSERLEVDLGKE